MSSWYRHIRLGDRRRLEAATWKVAGSIACLLPDGSFWQEWRLIAESPDSGERWLACKEDVGAVLWREVDVPADVVPGAIHSLQRLDYAGREYRHMQRDSYRIARVEGDIAAASRPDEQMEYAEYLAGTQRFALEWNEHGQRAFVGEKLSPQAVREGFRATGTMLEMRGSLPSTTRATRAARTAASDAVTSTIGVAVFVLVMLLNFWWEIAIDCNARTNAQTGTTEYACSDGSVRNSRPWNGK